MKLRLLHLAAALLIAAATAAPLGAQATDVHARLTQRGLPAALVAEVAGVAAEAASRGLPVDPLVEKAAEGWAKRAAAPRIIAAVRDLAVRLGAAREALANAGPSVDARVVGSAADALGRGISREDIVQIVSAAPAAEAASAGLAVAAALAAQGLDRALAVRVVVQAMRGGRAVADVLDLPAAARALQGQGVPPSDLGRRLLEGIGGGPIGQGRGDPGARPPIVPPGLGGEPPPGQSKRP
jgi:hypothetical protein